MSSGPSTARAAAAATSARALVVATGTPFPVTSGGRKRMVRLLEAIERAGALPHVIVSHGIAANEADDARDAAAARGWPLEVFPEPSGHAVARALRLARPRSVPVARRLAELVPTAAFAQFEEIGALQYARLAPPGVPVVASAYNVDSEVYAAIARGLPGRRERLAASYHARRLRTVERHAARRADVSICVSDHDCDYYRRCGGRPLLVANGVDDDFFELPAEPAPTRRVLFFGNYEWEPNAAGLVRYLRDAWPAVAAAVPDAELRIAGSGPLDRIRDAAAGAARVAVIGFVADLLAELAAARVAVAPIWVGGGTRIKVLEALAAARPVAGTTVGVERTGFEHGVHGLVADEPRALAENTVRLLTDDAAVARFAAAGRRLAERYRWTEVTKPLEERYWAWIGERAAVDLRTASSPSPRARQS